MAVEAKRGCGYRKVGGLYLVCDGPGRPCDRLPYPLTICPACGHGIKQTRGWTWLAVEKFFELHKGCADEWPCPFCMAPQELGRAGLIWVGERFYKTPAEFQAEASTLGISRRITAIPRGFELGKTWVMLAHPKAVPGSHADEETLAGYGDAVAEGRLTEQEAIDICTKPVMTPGIFLVFKPSRIEQIVTESQSRDDEFMDGLAKRGITPVVVPDHDPDHQGTVYDKDREDAVEPVAETA